MARDSNREARVVGPVSCGPCRALGVIEKADGTKAIEYVVAASPGLPVSRLTLPLPPGGDVAALHWNGPTATMSDFSIWHWQHVRTGGGAWKRVGSLIAPERPVKRRTRPFADPPIITTT